MSVPLPSSDQAPYHAGYWAEIEEKLTKLRNNPTADLLKKTVLRFLNQTKLDRDKYIANCPTAKEIMDHDELKTLTFTLEKQVCSSTFVWSMKPIIPNFHKDFFRRGNWV